MRKYIFISFCVCLSVKSFGQTTIEEYNYITKGYKIQVESGLDMKKGYELVDIGFVESGGRNAELKALYRQGNKVIVAYMIIYKMKGANPEYICVPQPQSSSEIKELYWKQLYTNYNSSSLLGSATNSSLRLQLIAYLLSEYLLWK